MIEEFSREQVVSAIGQFLLYGEDSYFPNGPYGHKGSFSAKHGGWAARCLKALRDELSQLKLTQGPDMSTEAVNRIMQLVEGYRGSSNSALTKQLRGAVYSAVEKLARSEHEARGTIDTFVDRENQLRAMAAEPTLPQLGAACRAFDALKLIQLDWRINPFLTANDPQALKQVSAAVLALECAFPGVDGRGRAGAVHHEQPDAITSLRLAESALKARVAQLEQEAQAQDEFSIATRTSDLRMLQQQRVRAEAAESKLAALTKIAVQAEKSLQELIPAYEETTHYEFHDEATGPWKLDAVTQRGLEALGELTSALWTRPNEQPAAAQT
jgi:hypothetical protein